MVVPANHPAWLTSPLKMATTSSPWAMRPLKGVVWANTSSVCSGLKSPDTPAKAATSASVTVRRDERKIRSEQHLASEQTVGVPHQLRREVPGRPAGQVDVDVRLVRGHRQRLVLPGDGWVGDDDGEVG